MNNNFCVLIQTISLFVLKVHCTTDDGGTVIVIIVVLFADKYYLQGQPGKQTYTQQTTLSLVSINEIIFAMLLIVVISAKRSGHECLEVNFNVINLQFFF